MAKGASLILALRVPKVVLTIVKHMEEGRGANGRVQKKDLVFVGIKWVPLGLVAQRMVFWKRGVVLIIVDIIV